MSATSESGKRPHDVSFDSNEDSAGGQNKKTKTSYSSYSSYFVSFRANDSEVRKLRINGSDVFVASYFAGIRYGFCLFQNFTF